MQTKEAAMIRIYDEKKYGKYGALKDDDGSLYKIIEEPIIDDGFSGSSTFYRANTEKLNEEGVGFGFIIAICWRDY